MANSTINVKVDMSGVAKKIRKICENKQLGQELAEAGAKYMNDKYVPKRSGALRWSYVAKPFSITWNAPYAIYQWKGVIKGKVLSGYTTAGTRSHWEQPKDVKEYLAKVAQNWMKHH